MDYAYSREFKFDNRSAAQVGGYGSVFGNIDHGLDRIEPGAFRKSILERGTIPMLHEHRDTVGVWHSLSEDDRGLKVGGTISNTAIGRDVRTLAKDGAITGLSIGYRPTSHHYDGDVRVLEEVDLLEVSLVTFPMNELARVTGAKSALARGENVSRTDLELLLRQAGLSRRQAKRLLLHGFDGMSASHSAAHLIEQMAARLEN